ncbi:MAG TPA: S9 family peptidase, partial [Candidatus Marinimicrobia bacterium]|nr:S9 family peptidase [Candidatus Neomarinimicrobiota bacterium]
MKRSQVIVYLFLLIGLWLSRYSKLTRQHPEVMTPPSAYRQPQEVTVHGDIRFDDYGWLREKDTQPVLNYLKAENEYTAVKLKHLGSLRKELYQEMRSRIKEDDNTVPYKYGDYFYYTRTEKGKQYDIYCRKYLFQDDDEEITLDLNVMAEHHDYLVLEAYKVSPDHQLLAFAYDTSGAEFFECRIKDLKTGNILGDRLMNLAGPMEWANDNKTLFYVTLNDAQRPFQLWRHVLGSDQSDDILVYEEPDDRFHMGLTRSKSGQYLAMDLGSNITTEVRVLDRDNPRGNFKTLIPREKGVEYYVYLHDNDYYVLSNKDAPNFKLMRLPIIGGNSTVVLPHREDTMLEDVSMFQNHLALLERINGRLQIRLLRINNGQWLSISMNEELYSLYFSWNKDWYSTFVRVAFSSFITPYSIIDIDLMSGEQTLKKQDQVLGGYDPAEYTVTRLWAPTHDGQKIPLSILYRHNLNLMGKNNCILYGYGAYGENYDPWFSSNIFSLVDRGLVFVRAHIRGSSYLGRRWYTDGRMGHKKNSFRDFISAAEYLIDEGITTPDNLAIYGGSAGGLLIGAAINMRPDLFKAAVADVPFVDVVNTMLDESIPLTAIEFEEWGNPRDKEMYDYMLSYSPYDNVSEQDYPHLLVLAGYNDPRVPYWEAAKWTAKIRAMMTPYSLARSRNIP